MKYQFNSNASILPQKCSAMPKVKLLLQSCRGEDVEEATPKDLVGCHGCEIFGLFLQIWQIQDLRFFGNVSVCVFLMFVPGTSDIRYAPEYWIFFFCNFGCHFEIIV